MPNTIAQNLLRLIDAYKETREAILEMGGTVNGGDGFDEFPDDIRTIPSRRIIYGWHVNPNESDSAAAVSYLEDAIGATPAAMGSTTFDYGSWTNAFFMPKPCMLKSDGTVDY